MQVSSVEGDATVNDRKNKIIVGYELHVKASWEGQLPGKLPQFSPVTLNMHSLQNMMIMIKSSNSEISLPSDHKHFLVLLPQHV